MRMNKDQFARELAQLNDITLKDATERTEQVLDALVRTLVSGKADVISFTGVGTFEVVNLPARRIWDVWKDEHANIPARRAVRFRSGDTFKAMLNGKKPLPEGRSAAIKPVTGRHARKETGDA